jgi:hypothetical protein
MIQIETVDARADVGHVWRSYVTVENWPRWTRSISSARWLDSGPMRIGHRAVVKQPGMPRMVWKVIALQDDAEFSWAARSPGVLITARHKVHANGDDTSRITLELEMTGPLAGVVNALTGRRNRRYLAMEAAGHKAAGEAAAQA